MDKLYALPADSEGLAISDSGPARGGHLQAEGRQSDLIWGYVAKIARRLKEEEIPGYVTNFAYSCFREVPSDEEVASAASDEADPAGT